MRLALSIGLLALAGCSISPFTDENQIKLLEEEVIQLRSEIFAEEQQLATPVVGCPAARIIRRH